MNEPRYVKVFISYSHDSDGHMDRVLWLSDKLRLEGVDCEIDQYETSPPGGWPRWTRNKITAADYVLIVCTQAYGSRYEATEKKGVGAGAKWEGAIVTQQIYEAEGTAHKFIPVTFSAEDVKTIPLELRGSPFYVLDSERGYEALYRRLTGQPEVIKQQLGKPRSLPPRKHKESFFKPIEESEPEAQSEPPENAVISDATPAAPASTDARPSAGAQLSEPPASRGSQGTPPSLPPLGTSRVRGVFTQHRHKVVTAVVALFVVLSAVYLFWPRQRIAVMPFPVESSDRDIEHLSGITTDFLERSLARVPQLSVKAHTSVFYYKDKRVSLRQIGADLNVQALLTGRIRQHENRVSVYVAVVDARTEEPLWNKSYEDELTNLPSLQSQIALDVSTYFSPRMSDADRGKVAKNDTPSYEALELYSQGRQLWRDRKLGEAIKKFEEAVKKDSLYAQAYIGLADSYALLEDYGAQRATVTLPKAEESVNRALAIDGTLAEAHASKGFVLFNRWDWAGAEKEFERAIELNPDYPTTYQWYSVLLRTIGGNRYEDALRKIKKARELDKLSPIIISNVGVYYLSKGDTDNAIDQFDEIIELYPDPANAHYMSAQRWLAMAYIKQGRKEQALAALQKGVEANPSSGTLEFQGYIYALADMREEALRIAMELEKMYKERKAIAFNVAAVYAGLDDKDRATQWLRTAKDDHSGALPFMRMPMFDSLRGDRRYEELLRQIDLTP
ncbi:MAG TPA: tetratricopeptide repeat protein [Pyrinomonadaceae bacterium]